MYIGLGIVLIAIGLLLALLVNSTVGIILIVLGILAVVLSFAAVGPFSSRREVIVERDRDLRPRTGEREITREREIR